MTSKVRQVLSELHARLKELYGDPLDRLVLSRSQARSWLVPPLIACVFSVGHTQMFTTAGTPYDSIVGGWRCYRASGLAVPPAFDSGTVVYVYWDAYWKVYTGRVLIAKPAWNPTAPLGWTLGEICWGLYSKSEEDSRYRYEYCGYQGRLTQQADPGDYRRVFWCKAVMERLKTTGKLCLRVALSDQIRGDRHGGESNYTNELWSKVTDTAALRKEWERLTSHQ
jgi:hypothetical protein